MRLLTSDFGASKKTFESIRVKSNFETVVENSKKLISISKKNFFRPEISAWCTVQKENYAEVVQRVALLVLQYAILYLSELGTRLMFLFRAHGEVYFFHFALATSRLVPAAPAISSCISA